MATTLAAPSDHNRCPALGVGVSPWPVSTGKGANVGRWVDAYAAGDVGSTNWLFGVLGGFEVPEHLRFVSVRLR